MSNARVLPSDANGDRFRIARFHGVSGALEIIGHEDTPSAAMRRVFSESGHVIAVDRRGYIYADNHKEQA